MPLLDQLVREYCVYRGIVDSGIESPLAHNFIFNKLVIYGFYAILSHILSFNIIF